MTVDQQFFQPGRGRGSAARVIPAINPRPMNGVRVSGIH
jgi:hypothetical protein